MSVMEAAAVPRQAPAGRLLGASPAFLRLASDAHLVALIRAGRSTAFEAVYDRHHRSILSFCRHMLGDRDEAEDAAQQTFLSAYKGILASDQAIALRPWLFTIARNRCFSILRARREVAVAEVEQGVGEEPAALVQRREDLRSLVLDVSRLPEDQRAALVMAELEALSHDEIAIALGVPRDKVKALVFQARESLSATRTARETDCAEIRRQLRTVRGPALRRGTLRRHLHDCAGCQEYRRQLRGPRPGRLAATLPIFPAALRGNAVYRALFGARTAGAAGSGAAGGGSASSTGMVASSALKLGLIKPLVGAAVAVVSAAGAAVVVHDVHPGAAAPPHHTVAAQASVTSAHRGLRAARHLVTTATATTSSGRVRPSLASSATHTSTAATSQAMQRRVASVRHRGLKSGAFAVTPPPAAAPAPPASAPSAQAASVPGTEATSVTDAPVQTTPAQPTPAPTATTPTTTTTTTPSTEPKSAPPTHTKHPSKGSEPVVKPHKPVSVTPSKPGTRPAEPVSTRKSHSGTGTAIGSLPGGVAQGASKAVGGISTVLGVSGSTKPNPSGDAGKADDTTAHCTTTTATATGGSASGKSATGASSKGAPAQSAVTSKANQSCPPSATSKASSTATKTAAPPAKSSLATTTSTVAKTFKTLTAVLP
jgi:RNA polymerase sigma factor (sigma-70 family)